LTDDTEVLQALRTLAMPVCLVGSAFSSESSCATSTLSYVSLRPPTISTSLSRTSKTYELAHKSKAFSISLLRDDQAGIAVIAGKHGTTPDKFSELDIEVRDSSGIPAMEDADTVMWCTIEQECTVGEYVLCVGRIESVAVKSSDGGPLLRYEGRYHALGGQLANVDASSYPL
jgi:flavin reductase (DIM6/NTAB) family NADH-FMN oxidoreductase RutF